MNLVKNQVVTEDYAIYNADCMDVLAQLQENSVDLVIYSPPFAGLYNYSSDDRDFSNCESKQQFLEQYDYLVAELARVTKKGRINAVHCTDMLEKDGEIWDFPSEIVKIHKKYGFKQKNRITISKDPFKVRMRTMVKSLMHKMVVEDSTNCMTAMPDYMIIFVKDGENEVPVTHPVGLKRYAGEEFINHRLLSEMKQTENGETLALSIHGSYESLRAKFKHETNPNNQLSYYIWRRYADSIWYDIDINNVLKFKDFNDEDDEKHVHPLQLDVIDRIVELYSNPNEVVLTPFAGVMSEVFSPVSMGRRAIGIELKETYFKQGVENMKDAKKRFAEEEKTLFG